MYTYVVAPEDGGIVTPEGLVDAILALSKGKLRVLRPCQSIHDTHLRLHGPLLFLCVHDPLVHNTRIIELGGPFRVLGNLLAIRHRRKGCESCRVLHIDKVR